ncbi:DinB superfamily protein [Cyclobacterium xiamenense]|uniref:DinB superfamily protein n=1 Tax=Cyclobacterium xiamenense TaxID=1297121 RepID=A0A1H6UF46_9BACT|nr:DinB family protein [Cyclobacterium xiamenense]SEI91028.1 DinB superfamily protein [Cyclobacterium xiamenense]
MQTNTELVLALWEEARTRFSNQLDELNPEDLRKKLGTSPNSVGFLIRHIADVELLFAKNVFGDSSLSVTAKTVIAKKDTGEWTDLDTIKSYALSAFETLRSILRQQTDADWETSIRTQEFGAKTKAEALGRITSHTAYHAGQLAIAVKYGRIPE